MAENSFAGQTPPLKQGGRHGKQAHSPWSAPRERKRRSKAPSWCAQPPAGAPAEPSVLDSIEELETYTSPPKRHHNEGSSPAARELALEAQRAAPFPPADALGCGGVAGPLGQGIVAGSTALYSPLACGLRAPSFTTCSPPISQQQRQPPPQLWQAGSSSAAEKQVKQLRRSVAFRLAATRQRSAAAAASGTDNAPGGAQSLRPVDSMPPLPAHAASAAQQLPAAFRSHPWQAELRAEQMVDSPVLPAAAAHSQHTHMDQRHAAGERGPPAAPSSTAVGLLAAFPQQQQLPQAGTAQHLGQATAHQQAGVARCSTGQDMETDLRSSWGSERSADITGWQMMQAQLRHEAEREPPREPAQPPSLGAAPPLQHRPGTTGQGGAARGGAGMMGASVDCDAIGAASVHSSLDGPACSDRQASMQPLCASQRSQRWQSHLSSPLEGGDGASPDPLLGEQGLSSSGNARRRASSHSKWNCFSCASPFSCTRAPGAAGDDSDDEVVRRNDSTDGFVIRRTASFLAPPSPEEPRRPGAAGEPGRRKHTTLNLPPEADPAELVDRQAGFSARCSATPGDHSGHSGAFSPSSHPGSGGSFSLPSGPSGGRSMSLSVALRDASVEELAGGLSGSDGAPTPTVDALNDMLKALSLCPAAHPKDAEELVAEACQAHAIQPNARTARTLEKMWAVHEQLYG